jgi:hypothetical protein
VTSATKKPCLRLVSCTDLSAQYPCAEGWTGKEKRARLPFVVPVFQWSDWSNSGIHLRYVTTVVKNSAFTRAMKYNCG